MNKTLAAEQLCKLTTTFNKEAAKLREIINAPEVPESLLVKPTSIKGDNAWWALANEEFGTLRSVRCMRRDVYGYYANGGNMFQTEALATAYADAINTMLLLRRQPGTVPASRKEQWVIRPHDDMDGLWADRWYMQGTKAEGISPCFSSRKWADAAIEAIGEDRILRMFKTFHHIGG